MEDVGRPWLVPVGLLVVSLVVVATAAGSVGLGVAGAAAVATAAVVVYAVAAVLFLLRPRAGTTATVALLVTMSVAVALLHGVDPTGPVVGLFLVTAFAPLRLPPRTAGAVSALAVLLFDVVLVVADSRPALSIAVVSVGAGFFFLFGLLMRTEREQRLRADLLVAELEESREAERRSAELAERARIAREMHDVLAHTLSGLVLQLDGARLVARSTDPEMVAVIDRAHSLARDGLVEARQAVSALRGTSALGPGLLPDLVDEHRRLTGSPCTLTVVGTPRPLPPDAGVGIYRVAQESLTNVRKHAPGAPVDITLSWADDEVVLLVVDHGGPAPDPDDGAGSGLVGMAERAALAGGSLETAATEDGFRVRLALPVLRADGP